MYVESNGTGYQHTERSREQTKTYLTNPQTSPNKPMSGTQGTFGTVMRGFLLVQNGKQTQACIHVHLLTNFFRPSRVSFMCGCAGACGRVSGFGVAFFLGAPRFSLAWSTGFCHASLDALRSFWSSSLPLRSGWAFPETFCTAVRRTASEDSRDNVITKPYFLAKAFSKATKDRFAQSIAETIEFE